MKSVGNSSPYSGSHPAPQNNAPPQPTLQSTSNLHKICGNSNCKIELVKPLKCGGCKQVYYCNENCQRQAWKTHKAVCKTITPQTTLQETKEKKATPKTKPSEIHIRNKEDAKKTLEMVRFLVEKKDQTDQAVTLLRKLVDFDPNFFTELGIHKEDDVFQALTAAGILFNCGHLDQAIELLNQVIKFGPHPSIISMAFDNLAHIYAHKKDFDKEQKYLEMAFDLNPENDACTRLVNSLRAQGKLDEAEKYLRKAIKLNPKNIDALFALGDILYQKMQCDEAEAFINEVIKLYSKYAPAYHILGDINLIRGKITEGMSFYKKALSLDPQNARYQKDYKNVLDLCDVYKNITNAPELENQMKSMNQVILLNSKAYELLKRLTNKEDLVLGAQTLKQQLKDCNNETFSTLLEWITKSEFNYEDLNAFSENGQNKQLLERLSKRGFSDVETSRFSQLLNAHVINNRKTNL